MSFDPPSSKLSLYESDDPVCTVVIDDEGRQGIWLIDREIPSGWRVVGDATSYDNCLARVMLTMPSDLAGIEALGAHLHEVFRRAQVTAPNAASSVRAAPRIQAISAAATLLGRGPQQAQTLAVAWGEIDASESSERLLILTPRDTTLWERIFMHTNEDGRLTRLTLWPPHVEAIPMRDLMRAFGQPFELGTTSPRIRIFTFGAADGRAAIDVTSDVHAIVTRDVTVMVDAGGRAHGGAVSRPTP